MAVRSPQAPDAKRASKVRWRSAGVLRGLLIPALSGLGHPEVTPIVETAKGGANVASPVCLHQGPLEDILDQALCLALCGEGLTQSRLRFVQLLVVNGRLSFPETGRGQRIRSD